MSNIQLDRDRVATDYSDRRNPKGYEQGWGGVSGPKARGYESWLRSPDTRSAVYRYLRTTCISPHGGKEKKHGKLQIA